MTKNSTDVGRIYLKLQSDYIYIHSIKVTRSTGDIYITTPLSETYRDVYNISNLKLSIHKDGKSFITTQTSHLKYFNLDEVRARVNDMGFRSDKIYSKTMHYPHLDDIKSIIKLNWSASIKDFNYPLRDTLRFVSEPKKSPVSVVVDATRLTGMRTSYYLAPLSLVKDDYNELDSNLIRILAFNHPSKPIAIIVAINEYS